MKRSRDAITNAAETSDAVNTLTSSLRFDSLQDQASCLKEFSDHQKYNVSFAAMYTNILERFYAYGGLESIAMIMCSICANEKMITHPNVQLRLLRILHNISPYIKPAISADILWWKKKEGEALIPRLIYISSAAKNLEMAKLKGLKLAIVYEHCVLLRDMYTTFGRVGEDKYDMLNHMLNTKYLEMAVVFLKSPFFQNRLDGLNALRYMCRVSSTSTSSSYVLCFLSLSLSLNKHTSSSRLHTPYLTHSLWDTKNNWNLQTESSDSLKPMSMKQLCETLKESGVVKLLLQGDGVHHELLKRCSEILSFLVKRNYFTDEHASMLWDAASHVQSHESVRHAVFDIILAIEKDFSKRHLDVLFEKIKLLPLSKWDQKFVRVVLQLQMHYEKERMQKMGGSLEEDEEEMKIPDHISDVRNHIPPGMLMLCDAVLNKDEENEEEVTLRTCLNALIQMLKWKTMRRVHKYIFVICTNSIRAHRCVHVCLKLLSETIQQHYGMLCFEGEIYLLSL